ncbi:MAG: hypothetical protein ABR988_04715 [Terriglobales bacterium]
MHARDCTVVYKKGGRTLATFISIRVSEHADDLVRFVNWTDCVDVIRPIVRLNQFRLSMSFEELENDD